MNWSSAGCFNPQSTLHFSVTSLISFNCIFFYMKSLYLQIYIVTLQILFSKSFLVFEIDFSCHIRTEYTRQPKWFRTANERPKKLCKKLISLLIPYVFSFFILQIISKGKLMLKNKIAQPYPASSLWFYCINYFCLRFSRDFNLWKDYRFYRGNVQYTKIRLRKTCLKICWNT